MLSGAAGWGFFRGVTQFTWLSPGISHWSTGDVVQLRLTVPAGPLTISGSPRTRQTLSAPTVFVDNSDGLTIPDSYQWILVDGTTETEVAGEISPTYRLRYSDYGKRVKVRVSFTDDDDNPETRTSAVFPATGRVTGRSLLPPDTRAPALERGEASGRALTLYYDDLVHQRLRPGPDAYTVMAGGVRVAVSSVATIQRRVTLTLESALAHWDDVTVSYAPPASNRDKVQDYAHNYAAALDAVAVANHTPATGPLAAPGRRGTVLLDALLTAEYDTGNEYTGFDAVTGLGSLSATSFSYRETMYSVRALGIASEGGRSLQVLLDGTIPQVDGSDLALYVGNTGFPFSSGGTQLSGRSWSNPTVTFTSGSTYRISIVQVDQGPEFDGDGWQKLYVSETARGRTRVRGGTVRAEDPADGTVGYSLGGRDAGKFAVDADSAGNARIWTVPGVDYDYESQPRCRFSYVPDATKPTVTRGVHRRGYCVTVRARASSTGVESTMPVLIDVIDATVNYPVNVRLESEPGHPDVLVAHWSAPESTATGYRLRLRHAAAPTNRYREFTVNDEDDRSLRMTGLAQGAAGLEYTVEVQARIATDSYGPWSQPARGRTVAASAPARGLPVVSLELLDADDAGAVTRGDLMYRVVVTNIDITRDWPILEVGRSERWRAPEAGLSDSDSAVYIARNRDRYGLAHSPYGFKFTSSTSGYRTVRVRTPAASVEAGPLTVSLAEGVGYTLGTVAELCVPIKARGEVSPRHACTSRGRNAEPEPLSAELLDLPASHGGEAFAFELRFSEAVSVSAQTLRESAFTVTNGSVSGASRIGGSDARWRIEVEPAADTEYTSIELAPTTDCAAAGAICTGDGRGLSVWITRNVLATVPGDEADSQGEEDPPPALTVAFETEPPAEHDGSSELTFRLAFSENLEPYSYKTLRDASLSIYQGATRLTPHVKRVDKKDPERRNQRWDVWVTPISKENLTIGLGPTHECTDNGAMCTEDDRALSHVLRWVVLGPPALSVADASVTEAASATVDFAVTMSRASGSTVTVGYATSGGSATPGSDYTETSGTLTFAPAETTKTVSVAVLDDKVNEGAETFTLTLSGATGGNAYISDASATGTIDNDDPVPQAWLARFGRTIASQAVDTIGGRLEGGGGSRVTVGGRTLRLSGEAREADERAEAARVVEALAAEDEPGGSRSMTGRELLLGSAFRLSGGGESGAPAWTAWGRFASGGFDAHDDGARMEATVTSGFLGADYSPGGWLAGVALSLSEGEGDYADVATGAGGEVESTLTVLYPYARLGLTERVAVWGLAGYGTGELTLTHGHAGEGAAVQRYRTDIAMRMGAAGVRGEVLSPDEPGGLAVAVKSDAFAVRTDSDAVRSAAGNLAATQSDASRVRLLVEGSRRFDTGGAVLTPSLELGVRHDGGDAERGTGIEAGAGLAWTGGAVSVEGTVRTLVAHESAGYEEWGAAGTVRIDPGASGRGLSLVVSPAWGAASSGTQRLWGMSDAGALGAGDGFEAGSRLEAELGYGVGAASVPGVVTPYAGLTLANGGERSWRAGARWAIAPGAALAVEATRSEASNDDDDGGAAHGVMLRGRLSW